MLKNFIKKCFYIENNVNTKTVENLEQMIEEVDSINEEGSLDEKGTNFIKYYIVIALYLLKQ